MAYLWLGLVVPPPAPWQIRGVPFTVVKDTLIEWQQTFDENSDDYKSALEMIAWQRTANGKHGTVALFHFNKLRALAQVHETIFYNEPIIKLRSVCTPATEDIAGTILMHKIFEYNVTVDWDEIKKNPRWFMAATFLRGNLLK